MVCFITAQLKLTLTEADLEHNEWTVSAGAGSSGAGVRQAQDVTSDH